MNSLNPLPRLSSSASLWFDGLRLVAAQTVVLGHSFDFFAWFSSLQDPQHLQVQRLAVSVFFVLSGFLIPYSIARKRSRLDSSEKVAPYGFHSYFIDRASRIYAALLPALVFIALIDALPLRAFATDYPAGPGNHSPLTWIANALHFQEYPLTWFGSFSIPIFGSGDPLWSLAVEWWIYVLFGVLVLRPRSPLAWALGAIAAVSVVHNLLGGTGDGIVIVWAMGWALFEAWQRLTVLVTSKVKPWLGALAIGFVSLALGGVLLAPQRSHFGLDLPFAGFFSLALLFLLLAQSEESSRSSDDSNENPPNGTAQSAATSALQRSVRWGASTSYTLYLTHFSVLTVLYELRDQVSPRALVATALVVSNLVAWMISQLGERHTPRLRRLLHR